jgi:lipopolysaccharide/colanic/teichoic acid biosynthesis glycosyltransferase
MTTTDIDRKDAKLGQDGFRRMCASSIERGIAASFGDVVFDPDGGVLKSGFPVRMGVLGWGSKRMLDLMMTTAMLVISAPFFLIIAMIVKTGSRGSVFYQQERIGFRGKSFQIWKFRTMVQNPTEDEHRQYIHTLLKEGSQADNRVDLLKKYIEYLEDKVTPAGRFLRATSLDELPQLLNVWLSQMSLVGPRPHPKYEVEEYKPWYRRRLLVKPGLTGWSKLNLRCTPQNYEEAILYDLWYVDHWSFWLDIRILFMTVPAVLAMKNAR